MANTANQKFAANFMTGISGLASSYAQAEAAKAQGQYAETVARINARFAEIEAREIKKQGERQAIEHGKKINQIVGAQRAAAAAQGILVGSGSAGQLEKETREIGYEEQQTIRNNAWRKAFGFKQESESTRLSGEFARSAADFEARNTLIGAGLNFTTEVASGYRNAYDPADYGKKVK